jgi:uncharacterized DUF497 family protein
MNSFEWDNKKRKTNLALHGVEFAIAGLVFDDPNYVTKEDNRNDYKETRYQTIGLVFGRELFVVWTQRGKNIRIISARHANKKEQRFYNESNKKTA